MRCIFLIPLKCFLDDTIGRKWDKLIINAGTTYPSRVKNWTDKVGEYICKHYCVNDGEF